MVEQINSDIHKYLNYKSDEDTFNKRELWKSWWPEIKLIKKGQSDEVASKLPSEQYISYYSYIKLNGDCDEWAMTAVEAFMEAEVADPAYIGIAIVLDKYGQSQRPRVPYNHAIAVVSVDEGYNWKTVDSQTSGLVSINYMGHDYYSVMLMDAPGTWLKSPNFGPRNST